MKVGDYVRIKNEVGWCCIGKIVNINDFREPDMKYCIDIQGEDYIFVPEDMIEKSSFKIIDLIQVGDYVNGGRVVEHAYEPGRLFVENIYVGGKGQTTIENYSYEITSKYCYDEPEFIESVVTKEQFESMEYKVGD